MTDEEILDQPFEVRAERVLACAFHGTHHCDIKKEGSAEFERWSALFSGDMATFDFDAMTRLVVAAHKNCVRVSVRQGGPRALKILIHPRKGRDGNMNQRHPTLDQAIVAIEASHYPA